MRLCSYTNLNDQNHPHSDEADQPVDKSKTGRVASRIPETYTYVKLYNGLVPSRTNSTLWVVM